MAKYKEGFEFTGMVTCKIQEVDDDTMPYLVEMKLGDITLSKQWWEEKNLEELISSGDPKKRKQFQQEKIDKLEQQLEEEKAKLETM